MSKPKKRRRSRFIRLRFRKGDPAHNLQTAVQHWVHANGGQIAIMGGVHVRTEPRPNCFTVGVSCLGMPPQPQAPAKKGETR